MISRVENPQEFIQVQEIVVPGFLSIWNKIMLEAEQQEARRSSRW